MYSITLAATALLAFTAQAQHSWGHDGNNNQDQQGQQGQGNGLNGPGQWGNGGNNGQGNNGQGNNGGWNNGGNNQGGNNNGNNNGRGGNQGGNNNGNNNGRGGNNGGNNGGNGNGRDQTTTTEFHQRTTTTTEQSQPTHGNGGNHGGNNGGNQGGNNNGGNQGGNNNGGNQGGNNNGGNQGGNNNGGNQGGNGTPAPQGSGPSPSEITIQGLTYGGTGCPAGTVAYSLSSDATTFTLIFDQFVASSGSGVPITAQRQNCQVNVNLLYPQGYSYSIVSVDYRGYAQLPAGVTATQSANYYFSGQTQQVSSHSTFTGPYDADYLASDQIAVSAMVFSPCGQVANGNVNAQVALSGSSSALAQGAQITVDSVDGKVTQQFAVQWRTCN